MRVCRSALVLAAATSAVALVLPSDAAPKYPSKSFGYTDAAGDANGVNGQGVADIFTDSFPDNVAGPGQADDGYDIVKVSYTSTGVMVKKGKRYFPQCTGFVVKVTLGGAPATSNAIYQVKATTAYNDAHWWLQYADGAAELRYGHTDADEPTGSTDDSVPLVTPAKLDATSISFTVKASDVKASGEKVTSLKLSGLSTEVRSKVGAAGAGYLTVPKWDGTAVTDGPVKVC